MLLPLLMLKLEKREPSEAIFERRANLQVDLPSFGLAPGLPLEVLVVEVAEVRSDELEVDRHWLSKVEDISDTGDGDAENEEDSNAPFRALSD